MGVAGWIIADNDNRKTRFAVAEVCSQVAAEVTASITEAAAAFPSMIIVMRHPIRSEA